MAKLKRREEQKKEDCWDLTRLVKDKEDYTNKINAVMEYNQKNDDYILSVDMHARSLLTRSGNTA